MIHLKIETKTLCVDCKVTLGESSSLNTERHMTFSQLQLGWNFCLIILCNGHIQHKLNYSEACLLSFWYIPFFNWREQRIGFQGYAFLLALVSDWCSHGNQAINSFLAAAGTGLLFSFKGVRLFNNALWEGCASWFQIVLEGGLETLLNTFKWFSQLFSGCWAKLQWLNWRCLCFM